MDTSGLVDVGGADGERIDVAADVVGGACGELTDVDADGVGGAGPVGSNPVAEATMHV